MNVLQHTLRVIGGCQAQVITHAGIPGLGQVFDRQLAFQGGDLQFQAQHHMQVIGGLVGLHADQRWLHLVDALVEGF